MIFLNLENFKREKNSSWDMGEMDKTQELGYPVRCPQQGLGILKKQQTPSHSKNIFKVVAAGNRIFKTLVISP